MFDPCIAHQIRSTRFSEEPGAFLMPMASIAGSQRGDETYAVFH
jgi:hypothetical protein